MPPLARFFPDEIYGARFGRFVLTVCPHGDRWLEKNETMRGPRRNPEARPIVHRAITQLRPTRSLRKNANKERRLDRSQRGSKNDELGQVTRKQQLQNKCL
jgi:hypothetical protein